MQIRLHGVWCRGARKRRIAVGRVPLARLKVLIFDEATSSLDHAAPEQLGSTLNLPQPMRPLFTHQVSVGSNVDEVVPLPGVKRGVKRMRPSVPTRRAGEPQPLQPGVR